MVSVVMQNLILKKNLAAAVKRWPNISAEELLKEPDFENYAVEDCVNGEKTVKARRNVTRGDCPFIYVHSKYDPSRAAINFAKTVVLDKSGGALILCGMGFGYEAREFLRNMGGDNRIIICEPDYGLLRHAFRNADLTDIILDGRVSAFAGFPGKKLGEELDLFFRHFFTLGNIEKAVLIKMPVYSRLYGNELDTAHIALINTAKYLSILKNSIVNLSELWYLSHFRNLKTVAGSYPADNFFDLLTGKPAVLVSAGPSLNKNADLLKEISGRMFVLCVYTALKVLEARGVRPDMVISLDGQQIIYDDFQNYAFDMPLIFCNTINPGLFRTHKGKTIAAMTGNDAFMANLLSGVGVRTEPVQTGESVACAAVDILCKMGADPVIFIGQDFAYSDGKNHADGTFYDGRNSAGDVDSNKFAVEAWDGSQVLTDDMWFVYLEWFRRYIREDGGKRTFIDATEGGALIKGAERMTFREAIDRHLTCGYDVEAVLEAGFAKGVMLDAAQARKLAEKLTFVKADLERCREPLREGIGLSGKLEEMYKRPDAPDPESVERILRKFVRIDGVLDEVKESAPIMDVLFTKFTLDLNFKRPEDMSDGGYVARRSLILYKSLLEAVEFTLPLIEETVAEMLEVGNRKMEAAN